MDNYLKSIGTINILNKVTGSFSESTDTYKEKCVDSHNLGLERINKCNKKKTLKRVS